ncbi:MAG: hypothetical protein AB3N28_08690 [Kordiimonas sp.]
MPKVNLELQMKFLAELDEALKDALGRYADDGADKLAELEYMKKEVVRAQRIISERMDREEAVTDRKSSYRDEAYREVAYQ